MANEAIPHFYNLMTNEKGEIVRAPWAACNASDDAEHAYVFVTPEGKVQPRKEHKARKQCRNRRNRGSARE